MPPNDSYSNQRFPVLIVEDNTDQQFIINHCLQVAIPLSEPIFTSTAQEALIHLDKCYEQQLSFPKLVLLDVYLPRPATGWMLLKSIRQAYPSLPVVVLSAHHDLDYVRQAYDLGAHSFIAKPFRLEDWETHFKMLYTYWCNTVTLVPAR